MGCAYVASNRYRQTERPCWFKVPTHGTPHNEEPTPCKGSRRLFPDVIIRNNTEAMCEVHARQYFGDDAIDRLIRLKVIAKWKVSEEKERSTDRQLNVLKGDTK